MLSDATFRLLTLITEKKKAAAPFARSAIELRQMCVPFELELFFFL